MESASRTTTKSRRKTQGMGRQNRQIKTPTNVPAVPGATGERPEPKPLARKVISFLFKIPPKSK